MHKILSLILCFILFSIADYFIVKFEVKNNIALFYDLHKMEVVRELNRMEVIRELNRLDKMKK